MIPRLPDHAALQVEDVDGGEVVAEDGEVLEAPDDLLVAGDLDELWGLRTSMGVAEDQVAVWQGVERRHPGEGDAGKLLLLQAPDHFARTVHLDDAIAVAAGDDRVAA